MCSKSIEWEFENLIFLSYNTWNINILFFSKLECILVGWVADRIRDTKEIYAISQLNSFSYISYCSSFASEMQKKFALTRPFVMPGVKREKSLQARILREITIVRCTEQRRFFKQQLRDLGASQFALIPCTCVHKNVTFLCAVYLVMQLSCLKRVAKIILKL